MRRHAREVVMAGVQNAVFAQRERQAAKALELGLIPQAELDRIKRQRDARSALAADMLSRAE
jgi:hypothetical protein